MFVFMTLAIPWRPEPFFGATDATSDYADGLSDSMQAGGLTACFVFGSQ